MKNRKALGWGEFILGILLIIIGIYTLIKPYSTIRGVTFIYGLAALITGIIDIIFYVKLENRFGVSPVPALVGGIISIIAGLLILFNLGIGTWVIVVLFPIWFIAHCIARLAHLPFIRITSGTGNYYFTLFVNIIGLVLGIMMIFDPVISFFSIGYLIGIYLIFLGIDSIVFTLNLLDSL